MEKCNVVHEDRTPDHELNRPDAHWDKAAADEFVVKPVPVPERKSGGSEDV